MRLVISLKDVDKSATITHPEVLTKEWCSGVTEAKSYGYDLDFHLDKLEYKDISDETKVLLNIVGDVYEVTNCLIHIIIRDFEYLDGQLVADFTMLVNDPDVLRECLDPQGTGNIPGRKGKVLTAIEENMATKLHYWLTLLELNKNPNVEKFKIFRSGKLLPRDRIARSRIYS